MLIYFESKTLPIKDVFRQSKVHLVLFILCNELFLVWVAIVLWEGRLVSVITDHLILMT